MGSGETVVGPRVHEGGELATLEPEGMRNYLLAHPLSRGGRLWCDRVIEGVDKGSRADKILFAKAMGWVQAEHHIALMFVQQLGLSSEKELRSLVKSGEEFEQIKADVSSSLDEQRESAVELLLAVLREQPDWRADVLKRLGSAAEEAEDWQEGGYEPRPGTSGAVNGSVGVPVAGGNA